MKDLRKKIEAVKGVDVLYCRIQAILSFFLRGHRMVEYGSTLEQGYGSLIFIKKIVLLDKHRGLYTYETKTGSDYFKHAAIVFMDRFDYCFGVSFENLLPPKMSNPPKEGERQALNQYCEDLFKIEHRIHSIANRNLWKQFIGCTPPLVVRVTFDKYVPTQLRQPIRPICIAALIMFPASLITIVRNSFPSTKWIQKQYEMREAEQSNEQEVETKIGLQLSSFSLESYGLKPCNGSEWCYCCLSKYREGTSMQPSTVERIEASDIFIQ
jgi:hypothetical protein